MNFTVAPELTGAVAAMRDRALRYVRECTALAVAPGRTAILADHRLLPLSWTRDAYYQALLLLTAGADDADAEQAGENAEIVGAHLRWLWLLCDRPAGWWARSHHADGRRKDERMQADQQLYPLLELCDYVRATGGLPELASDARAGGAVADRAEWSRLVAGVVAMLEASANTQGLLASEENAADDAVALPFLLSTQILAWYTLRRTAELASLLDVGPFRDQAPSLVERADGLRQTVRKLFTVRDGARHVWAYAIDAAGGALLYQDANDLPTAFAPLWGFCAAEDPDWQATMEFAFSVRNDGYVEGPFGGLGSGHTAGTWSLGLIQEWVARSLAGDERGAGDALRRLAAVALDDWMLPEASDPATGRLAARPWFAWPGAVLGALSSPRVAALWAPPSD